MTTLHPKKSSMLVLSPLAMAIFMLQPVQAQAFTSLVNSGAVVNGETVTGGLQSISSDGTANNTVLNGGTQTVHLVRVDVANAWDISYKHRGIFLNSLSLECRTLS